MPPDERSDEAVAEAVQQGEQDAFGVLIDRYHSRMVRYARKFLFGREDTEDLVQDVFVKVYVNIHSFDAGRRFSTWLYRIAHNTYVNALRSRISGRILYVDFDTFLPHLAAEETADGPSEREEIRHLLAKALEALPAKYREVLVLYYYEELDYQAIADVLAIPVSTVGVRLRRGRERLRKLVASQKS